MTFLRREREQIDGPTAPAYAFRTMELAFEQCADAYEAFRPGYPTELFEHLTTRFRVDNGSVVVDVGAGTGRATWPLADRGCRVYAIEPSAAMCAKGAALATRFGDRVRFLNGAAEAIPLVPNLADLLISAQAFHWFDPRKALPEAARVLKPNAGIALFWNNRDAQRNPVAADLDALIARANPEHTIAYRQHPWEQVLAASGLFLDVQRRTFYHTLTMTADSICGLFRSVSYVWNVLGTAGRIAFEHDLRLLVERYYGHDPFPFVYRLEAYTAARPH